GQDLARLREQHERNRPNCPERVPSNAAQLAFERVLATFGDTGAANDAAKDDAPASAEASPPEMPPSPPPKRNDKPMRRHSHGRRRLDLSRLAVERVELTPPEVTAVGGKGFVRIGEEISDRVAFRPASYFRLRLVRSKWVPVAEAEPDLAAVSVVEGATTS